MPDYRAPEVSYGPAGERSVRNHHARQRLLVRDALPERGDLTLLFLDGRAAARLPGGGSAWADLEGDRVVLFDRRGRVERVLQDGQPQEYALSAPVTVVPVDGGLRVEERDGSAVLFPFHGPPRRLAASPAPVVGGGEGVRVAARSVLYFPMAPVRSGDPLLWLIEDGAEPRPVGSARPGRIATLGQLDNAGWAAVTGAGDIYFAPALRPELLRFEAAGEPLWRASWEPERDVDQARLQVVDGVLRPDFSVLQYGISEGPDGRIYLLAASREDRRPDRLLVFDDDGVLVREGRVDPSGAVYTDARGRVFVMSLDEALSRTPEAERVAFRRFELASLYDAEDSVRLDDYAGRVVVVNFWASWCPPCRREIPLLEELSRQLDPRDAVVIGLNEDVRPAEGRAFLAEVGGVSYSNGAGGSRLRASYGYRGLPYTLVLDREHRIARSFYGFGSSLEPIREAVREELGRSGAALTGGGPYPPGAAREPSIP